MKIRILAALFLALLWCASTRAQDYVQNYTFVIPTVGGPGTGTTFANTGITSFAIFWSPATTVSSCAVQVDSSPDGVTWGSGDLIGTQNCAVAGSTPAANLPSGSIYLRVNLTVLTGNGGVNVTLKGWGGAGSNFSVNAGQNTQVIFNSNGQATGSPGFTYTPSTANSGNVALNGPAQLGPLNVGGNHLLDFGNLPLPLPNADGWSGPSSGDPCGVVRLLSGYPGGGILQGFPSAMVAPGCGHYVNYGSSGDMNHSTGRVTGATDSVRQTVVCTFSFCQAGSFHIIVHVSAATASCTGSPTIQFFVNYDDDVGNNITQPIPLSVNGSPTLATTMGIGNNTNKGFGEWGFYNIAASNISYSAALASPCSVGTASFNYDVEVVETL